MSEANVAGTEAGAAPVDADEAKYAAAFAEEGITTSTPADAQPAADTEPKPAAEAQDRAPLPPEEVEKRWNDTKAALREERRKGKERDRELAELRAQRTAPPAPPAPAPQTFERPDPETDPLGYLKYVEARIEAGDAQAAEQQRAQHAQTEQQRQVQEVVGRVMEYERDFAEDTPDYHDAMTHLRGVRAQHYIALGYDQNTAGQLVDRDALQTAHDLMRNGRDPAQAFYALAKQAGFSGKAPEPAPTPPAPAPAPNALDRVKAGQKAAQTLSGSGGGSTNNELDVSSINRLEGAAFDSAFEKYRAAAKRAERQTGW